MLSILATTIPGRKTSLLIEKSASFIILFYFKNSCLFESEFVLGNLSLKYFAFFMFSIPLLFGIEKLEASENRQTLTINQLFPVGFRPEG